jgi:hypothetical protein
MNLSIFNSTHNHNNTKFSMIHVVCPNTKSTKEIYYEIQGNMGTSIETNVSLEESLGTPYIISFFGKKGEIYFIRIKCKESLSKKETKTISFYKYPDDYNVNENVADDKINIEITKKREEKDKSESDLNIVDELVRENMVMSYEKKRKEDSEDDKEDSQSEEEEEENNTDTELYRDDDENVFRR